MSKKIYNALIIVIIVNLIDRFSKILIANKMMLYQSIRVWGNFFRITYVTNPYAGFSLKFGNYYTMMILTFIAIVIILFYFWKTSYFFWKNFALSLIIGGAFGNYYDRIVHREVIDFLDFGIKRWRYATFNIADSSVVIGVIILFIFVFNEHEKD